MMHSAKDRAVHSPRKKASLTPPSGLRFHRQEIQGRSKGSVSSLSHVDEPSQRDEISPFTARVENTYQLGPRKHFPMVTINHVLKDVLTKYLQEEKYEPELCRKMTKLLSETQNWKRKPEAMYCSAGMRRPHPQVPEEARHTPGLQCPLETKQTSEEEKLPVIVTFQNDKGAISSRIRDNI